MILKVALIHPILKEYVDRMKIFDEAEIKCIQNDIHKYLIRYNGRLY